MKTTVLKSSSNPRLRFSTICLLGTLLIAPLIQAGVDPDKDEDVAKLLHEADLVAAKNPEAAIRKCDQIIEKFRAAYGNRKEKVYCSRSGAETILYLAGAIVDGGKKGGAGRDAIAISSTWADAYFLKAYALQELGRIGDAKATIKRALELSPYSPHYLCELGAVYQLEKNWPKALETFKQAEDNISLSPDEAKSRELGQARRGKAYVLVELGKLNEAQKIYQECLKSDPNDKRAADELEYVRQLKQKRK